MDTTTEVGEYKVRLERYIDAQEDDKILRILGKLVKSRITLDCLMETGIGKVVGKLRKYKGDIGAESTRLIVAWKEMSKMEAAAAVQSESSARALSKGQNSSSRHQNGGTASAVLFVPPITSSNGHGSTKRKSPSPGYSQPTSAKRSHLDKSVDSSRDPDEQSLLDSIPDLTQDEALMRLLRRTDVPSTSSYGHSKSAQQVSSIVSNHTTRRNDTRVKMFSGRSKAVNVVTQVPKLFDLCIRALIDKIDKIEEMGPIPYHVIKPVLEKCSPEQLRRLEDFNEHLMEDTDELWFGHFNKAFPSAQLDEKEKGDTYRENYERQVYFREERLRSLTGRIKQSTAERAAPVREVKILYVDSTTCVKGSPKFQRPSHSGSGIRQQLKKMNVPPPPSRSRGAHTFGSGAASASKPVSKSAPLMQKSRQAFKNSFRR
ncbi:putative Transcription elongation factor B polypeptide 3 [Hypsibius exemplaris]|uniref:Transcription elongation factor B polypeptide 3 n=1 Tax=Hypsibius exemplaris TaxID=2072580 RepID=A0A1W0WLZ1_HYPEX|nr:putative Transcription elongation factor B polypeptide 3 [Hypsibius exemplaris]